MQYREAFDILNDWTMRLDGKPPSTNKRVHNAPVPEAKAKSWWFENAKTTPDWRNPRTIAYLAAYVEIDGPSFSAAGIPVDEGFIHPDRAVIRSLLDARCLTLSNGRLRLTDKGQALLAPMLVVDDERVTRGN